MYIYIKKDLSQPVTIDFELREDGFWIVVENISGVPQASFTAVFLDINNGLPINILGMPLRGNPTGARSIVSGYDLFTKCAYMVPGKRFELFVENDRVFFQVNPSQFKISVSATDTNNNSVKYIIVHNLAIYHQLIQTSIANH